jgi:hypothetical protein
VLKNKNQQTTTMKWGIPIKARRPVGFMEPCIPTAAAKVPEGPMWVHEIKHDGYRLIVRRSGDRMRLFTRRGYDWSERYSRIVDAAKRLKGSFVIDGEAVVSDKYGIADLGFDVDPQAGPFAFEGYTLLEMLKIAPVVQYYDVYADVLNFQRIGTVANPSFGAKFAVIAFRAVSDLIIIAALKRLFDSARRAAAGFDLRPAMKTPRGRG